MCDCTGGNRNPKQRHQQAARNMPDPRQAAREAEAARQRLIARGKQEALQVIQQEAPRLMGQLRTIQRDYQAIGTRLEEEDLSQVEREELETQQKALDARFTEVENQRKALLRAARPKLLAAARNQHEASEAVFMTLEVSYGSYSPGFNRYIQDDDEALPGELNCWEAVVCSAVESGALRREDLAEYDLYDSTDEINTVLGLDTAAVSTDSTTAPQGKVAFLFHTSHVVQCIGNGECLSWWGGGAKKYRLSEVLQMMDDKDNEMKRSFLSRLTSNDAGASDALLGWLKLQDFTMPDEAPYDDPNVFDDGQILDSLIYDLIDHPGWFTGLSFDDIWRFFLPNVNNPRHGALRMGDPTYLE